MAGVYHFKELTDLIEYYTTTGSSTLDKDLHYLELVRQLNFQEKMPYKIMYLVSTIILWLKDFYTACGQYLTLYNFLAISCNDLCNWEQSLENPYECPKPNLFRHTVVPALLYKC